MTDHTIACAYCEKEMTANEQKYVTYVLEEEKFICKSCYKKNLRHPFIHANSKFINKMHLGVFLVTVAFSVLMTWWDKAFINFLPLPVLIALYELYKIVDIFIEHKRQEKIVAHYEQTGYYTSCPDLYDQESYKAEYDYYRNLEDISQLEEQMGRSK